MTVHFSTSFLLWLWFFMFPPPPLPHPLILSPHTPSLLSSPHPAPASPPPPRLLFCSFVDVDLRVKPWMRESPCVVCVLVISTSGEGDVGETETERVELILTHRLTDSRFRFTCGFLSYWNLRRLWQFDIFHSSCLNDFFYFFFWPGAVTSSSSSSHSKGLQSDPGHSEHCLCFTCRPSDVTHCKCVCV